MKVVILVGLILGLCSCAVGPLVMHETARPVGHRQSDLAGGYGNAGYVLKWSHGLTPQLDLGLQIESLSLGARLKYAFRVRHHGGLSLAAAAGAGFSLGGRHYYADFLTSYLQRWWEPYGTFRVVHVTTDSQEIASSGSLKLTLPALSYEYGQAIVGSRFWFTPEAFFLSLEVSSLIALSSGAVFSKTPIFGGVLGYRF